MGDSAQASDRDRAQAAFRLPRDHKVRLGALAAAMSRSGIGRVSESDLLREAVRRLLESEEPTYGLGSSGAPTGRRRRSAG